MISVVIPCYNEEEVLDQLYERFTTAAEQWSDPYEVVLVDDGSIDRTWEMVSGFHARDPRWKCVRFARNFGHQMAVSAGLHHAGGDCVIIIDADLQDPPEVLQGFIHKWREGFEVVYAVRRKRKEGLIKKACYKAFYRILHRLADIDIPYDSGDFCLMDRKVVDILKAMPERNRFLRGLRSYVGFRQVGLEYERSPRAAGEVKYTWRKLFRLAVDGILAFSTVPLKMATILGFIVSVIALGGALFTLLQRIFAGWFREMGFGPVPGFATTVISILFLGGVQLVCLGILGEYLGRIYDEVKKRPLWTTRETLGFNSDSD